jgi:hypothetical protein
MAMGITFTAPLFVERKQVEEELLRHNRQFEATVLRRTTELRLTRDAAEAANRAKSLFLTNMSMSCVHPSIRRIAKDPPRLAAALERNVSLCADETATVPS